MISLRGITVRAGGFALRDISLEIPRGQYVVLMGRTGCGKTTLLETICGLRAVEAGMRHIIAHRLRPNAKEPRHCGRGSRESNVAPAVT